MKKYLSIVVAALMALSMMAACRSNSGDASPTTAPTADTPAAADPTTAPAATDSTEAPADTPVEDTGTEILSANDMGGYHMVVKSSWAHQWVFVEGRDILEYNELFVDQMLRVEEELNCTIEFIASNDWDTQIEIVITSINSGDKYADFADLSSGHFLSLAMQGMLRDLFTLNAYTPGDPRWDSTTTRASNINGKQFGTFAANQEKVIIYVNNTFLNSLGLEPLDAVIARDDWNWDTFRMYCLTATQDLDGDGAMDTYGVLVSHWSELASTLLFTNGSRIIDQDGDGRFYFAANTPNAFRALDFMGQLMFEDGVHAKDADGQYNLGNDYFAQGTTLFLPARDYVAGYFAGWGVDFEYQAVPLPKGPDYNEWITWNSGLRTFCMPVNIPDEDAEKAMTILNAMFEPIPGHTIADTYINMRNDYYSEDMSIEYMKMLDDVNHINYIQYIGLGPYGSMIFELREGANTAAAAVASHEDAMQDFIDVMLNLTD